jgi:hypothetical protein
MTLGIMALGITILSILALFAILGINNIQHKSHLALQRSVLSAIMLSVVIYYFLCIMSLCSVLLFLLSWRLFLSGCRDKNVSNR